jgi:hypothetical protein
MRGISGEMQANTSDPSTSIGLGCLAFETELGIVLPSWPRVDEFDWVRDAIDIAMIHVVTLGIRASGEVIECDRVSCIWGISLNGILVGERRIGTYRMQDPIALSL